MTLDEAIKDLEYGTKQLEMEIKSGLWIKGSEAELRCKEGIALNKQHIEWLTELKELRNSIGAVKLSNMKEALALIRTLKAQLNGWEEDPFGIIAEVCRPMTECIRYQWCNKCPFSRENNSIYEGYPDEWRD